MRRVIIFFVFLIFITGAIRIAVAQIPSLRVPFIGSYNISAGPGCSLTHGQGAMYWRSSEAIDFANNFSIGTPIYAAFGGKVTVAGNAEFGHTVKIENSNGYVGIYVHLSKIHAYMGQTVQQGDLIAYSGNTGFFTSGPHLHFEVRDGSNLPVHIADSLSVVWDDTTAPVDYCYDSPSDSDSYSGAVSGPVLSTNTYSSCTEFVSQNFEDVALFDNVNCQGNILWLSGISSGSIVYNLNLSTDFNDRARSVYVPTNGSVAYASLQYYMNPNATFTAYVDSVLFYQSGIAPTATPTLTPTPTVTPSATYTATLTLTPTATTVPSNIIANGSFEALTSGWADNWIASAASVTIDTNTNGSHGTNSLRLAPDTVNTKAISVNYAVSPSASYNWTFYAKTTSGSGEFGFYIDEYDSNGTWISGQWKNSLTGQSDGGHQYSYTPSSGTVAFASLQFYMIANTTFDAYVDSVSVTQN